MEIARILDNEKMKTRRMMRIMLLLVKVIHNISFIKTKTNKIRQIVALIDDVVRAHIES